MFVTGSGWCVMLVVLGRWSVEEPNNNPLQNDLGLVLKVVAALYHYGMLFLFK